MPSILVINGPNLNLLGQREEQFYGIETLDSINAHLQEMAVQEGVEVAFFQSNHEGDLIDKIQEAREAFDCIILNAGAFTHYSIAIHDALKAVQIPFIEVHLSNIYAREAFRHQSLLSPIAAGGIFGFGAESYYLAFQAAIRLIEKNKMTGKS